MSFYRSTSLYCRIFYKGSLIRPLSSIFDCVRTTFLIFFAHLSLLPPRGESYAVGVDVFAARGTFVVLYCVVLSSANVDFLIFGCQK